MSSVVNDLLSVGIRHTLEATIMNDYVIRTHRACYRCTALYTCIRHDFGNLYVSIPSCTDPLFSGELMIIGTKCR